MKYIFSILLSGLIILPAAAQNVPLTNQFDSVSYSVGILLGTSIGQAGIKDFNDKALLQGITDVTRGKTLTLTAEQANELLGIYMENIQKEKAKANLAAGQKFLAENAKKEGVVTLPSGLQYKIINEGIGNSPLDTSMVTVHYTGTFIDGTVFDSSVERGEPATFGVNQVIQGWTEALKLMKVGANWMLYIPSELGYGDSSMQGMEPNSVLIFDVQLISIN
jgi:FKBP-type peptidyl-prolyl cis-trans isomerase FklB